MAYPRSYHRRLQTIQRHLSSSSTVVDGFDVAEVNARYDHERDIRLQKSAGQAQYVKLRELAKQDARFAKMLDDPWGTPQEASSQKGCGRPVVTDHVEVAVVGAGYGGLTSGARLVLQGVPSSSIRLVDSASDVGGTWYWNRYPGAMCDVESFCYMPLLEEIGYTPTERYAHQPELLAHSQMIARQYGLYERALFSTTVSGLQWDDDARLWTVHTEQGDAFSARFVIANFGTFPDAKLPKCPGLTTFQGKMFHTSRWDYAYTGGDPTTIQDVDVHNHLGKKKDNDQNSSSSWLHRLRDKTVAIIGTGATAVQVVPHLGKGAQHLYVFQRTPSSVDARNNIATTEEFAAEHLSVPGWQRKRMANFTDMTMSYKPGVKDLVQDGWTKPLVNLNKILIAKRQELMQSITNDDDNDDDKDDDKKNRKKKMLRQALSEMVMLADMRQMHAVRLRAESEVTDARTAEQLKPWYQQFCKRPCFHDDYLATFNRPNVELVHSPSGVEAVTKKGVIVDGKEYEVDCIIFATGFEIGWDRLDCGYPIWGKDGKELKQAWGGGTTPRTLRSSTTCGFPNLFLQNGPQGTLTVNFVQKIDEKARHVAHMVAQMRSRGLTYIEPTQEAEDEYCATILRRSGRGATFKRKCTPGYYNREGTPGDAKTLNSDWGTPNKFFAMLEKLRKEGRSLEGYNVK